GGLSYFLVVVAIWRTLTRQSWCFHLVLVIHFYLSIILAVACVSFVSWQLKIIFNGQTSYEAVKRITKYCKVKGGDGPNERKKVRLYENFVSSCGSPLEFFLCLIVPFLKTRLPGDGIKWST
ncbi:hypothetical protein EGW08_014836, partial [Elysia chlorotica]